MSGTPKQAKGAIRCLYVNVYKSKNDIFDDIVETTKTNLEPDSKHYETAIVALGHLAINVAEKYNVHFKNMISRKVYLTNTNCLKLLSEIVVLNI